MLHPAIESITARTIVREPFMEILNAYQRARILLVGAAVLAFAIFWVSGSFFGFPGRPGFEGGVLQQPSPVLALLVLLLTMAAAVLVGTTIAGMVRFNAGLAAGCLGLGAWSARVGDIRDTILWGLSHGSPGALFVKLAVEAAILAMLIGACWFVLRTMYLRGLIRDRESVAGLNRERLYPDGPALGSLAVQALATALLMGLIARTEEKQQVWAAVFIASFFGPVLAQFLYPASPAGWHWLPPLVVGIAGYLLNAGASGIEIGTIRGGFAAMARPLPLDYASAGPAGAILGLWMVRRWERERQAEKEAAGR